MTAETIVKSINENRLTLKDAAAHLFAFIGDLKSTGGSVDSKSDNSEMFANLMLAYRHIEDASMRLGKAIQATDGGESVYDKKTTVGVKEEVQEGEARKPYADKE